MNPRVRQVYHFQLTRRVQNLDVPGDFGRGQVKVLQAVGVFKDFDISCAKNGHGWMDGCGMSNFYNIPAIYLESLEDGHEMLGKLVCQHLETGVRTIPIKHSLVMPIHPPDPESARCGGETSDQ